MLAFVGCPDPSVVCAPESGSVLSTVRVGSLVGEVGLPVQRQAAGHDT